MSRRTESPQGEGPKASARLTAERIQESLEGERIQEAQVGGEGTVFREVSELVEALEGAAPTDREAR